MIVNLLICESVVTGVIIVAEQIVIHTLLKLESTQSPRPSSVLSTEGMLWLTLQTLCQILRSASNFSFLGFFKEASSKLVGFSMGWEGLFGIVRNRSNQFFHIILHLMNKLFQVWSFSVSLLRFGAALLLVATMSMVSSEANAQSSITPQQPHSKAATTAAGNNGGNGTAYGPDATNPQSLSGTPSAAAIVENIGIEAKVLASQTTGTPREIASREVRSAYYFAFTDLVANGSDVQSAFDATSYGFLDDLILAYPAATAPNANSVRLSLLQLLGQ